MNTYPVDPPPRTSFPSPEAWLAQVLADEIHELQIMTRSLEFSIGFAEGVQSGRWQGAQEVAGSDGKDVSVAGSDR